MTRTGIPRGTVCVRTVQSMLESPYIVIELDSAQDGRVTWYTMLCADGKVRSSSRYDMEQHTQSVCDPHR